MKRVSATHVLILLVPLLLALHGLSTHQVQRFRNSISYQNTLHAPLLPKEVLSLVAGEFKGLMADFLMLEISAFIDAGEEKSDEEWKRITYHFSQAMALDPYFAQTYRMVQAFLPWKGYVQQANQLLEVAQEHLTWDWYPGFFIGFNYFNELKDYAKASKYLLEASKIEGAPSLLATLGARLAQQSGQTVTAIAFLKTMLKNPDNDATTNKMISMRLEVLKGVLILERAVAMYEQRFGKPIATLEDLVRSGILEQIPVHGEMGSFGYSDGKITY